jgi:tetratricopeptide (TPR) repeat protein
MQAVFAYVPREMPDVDDYLTGVVFSPHMEITKKHWIVAGVSFLIAVLVASVVWFFFPRRAIAPEPVAPEPSTATSTPESVATTTLITTTNRPATSILPSIAKSDSIASWDFTGAYANHPDLIMKANADITRFSGLLITATSSTSDLLVSIANDYDLLGDGKQEFQYLSRAVAADPTSGLPWHNIGVLMEKLGAPETAKNAYARAVLLQPQFEAIQQP